MGEHDDRNTGNFQQDHQQPTPAEQPAAPQPVQAPAAAATAPRRRVSPWWIVGAVIGAFFILCIIYVLLLYAQVVSKLAGGTGSLYGARVGVIHLDGIIADGGRSGSLFGAGGTARRVLKYLHEAAEDDSIKAVVLRINSPGGSAAASQELYMEALRLRKKKPLIVSMGDVAASGGYYVASAATYIIADPATTTGSIGVIAEFIRFNRLGERLGIDVDAITSGPFKDAGSPWRQLRPQERKLFQSLVMNIYTQFVNDVAAGRKMDTKKVRQLADGRVYTGAQAKKLGLVDELGNYYDAISYAGKKCGLGPNPPIKEYGRGVGLLSLLAETLSHSIARAFAEVADSALQYRLLMSPLPQPRTQSR